MNPYKYFSNELSNLTQTEVRGDVLTQTLPIDKFPYIRISVIKDETKLFVLKDKGMTPYSKTISKLSDTEIQNEFKKVKSLF